MKTEEEIGDKLRSLKIQFAATKELMEQNNKFSVPHFWTSQIGLKQRIELLEWILEKSYA